MTVKRINDHFNRIYSRFCFYSPPPKNNKHVTNKKLNTSLPHISSMQSKTNYLNFSFLSLINESSSRTWRVETPDSDLRVKGSIDQQHHPSPYPCVVAPQDVDISHPYSALAFELALLIRLSRHIHN